METYKTYLHNPPHLFRENAIYFITASTYKKVRHFKNPVAKTFLRDSIFRAFGESGWTIIDWVVLDNHYHLLVNATESPERLPKIIRNIHRFTATFVNKNGLAVKGAAHIWHNYWDTCIKTVGAFYTIAHYIWRNPVKHGYVTDPFNWEFGSFRTRFTSEADYCAKIMAEYPLDRLRLRDDF
ncbi:MAG: transposase [Candidatus Marinimicrobia bacterium]|nr:transposase [Candidatus Neomarinimicrobiota bacterium]